MGMMVCPRNYTLRTTTGHVISFKAGVPTYVPPSIAHEAMAVNILPVDGNHLPSSDTAAPGYGKAAITGAMREALILHMIHQLVQENETASFTGGGRPKASVLGDRLNFTVPSTELNLAWDRYRDLTSAGESLPEPKNMRLVMDAAALRTTRDITDFASLLGVPEDAYRGETLANQKAIMIGAAIAYSDDVPLGSLDEA